MRPDIDSLDRAYGTAGAVRKAEPAYTLPTSDSPDLALVEPTAAELRLQRKCNGASWRGALSVDAYLRREECLQQTDLAKDSGITYWVLVDRAAPAQQREVLAGCETLRKHALVVREGGRGVVEETICHGVGSVFTPEKFRGRGYGARMIRELDGKLHLWQAEKEKRPCLFSVLYSDIGKVFYAKNGWKPYTSSHIHLPPRPKALIQSGHAAAMQVTHLKASDLPALCTADEHLQRQQLLSHAAAHPDKPSVALIPDIDTIRWHHAREDFVSNELYSKTPEIKGALVTIPAQSADAAPSRVWAIWTRVWYNENVSERKENVMFILRLAIDDADARNGKHDLTEMKEEVVEATEAILKVAQQEAHEWNLEVVELWSPLDASVREACKRIDGEMGSNIVDREEESIASLRWYGGGAGDENGVQWLDVEKHGWM